MQATTEVREELRGVAALQRALQTGEPLFRRYALGLREEPVRPGAAYALWGAKLESELVCYPRTA
jgi:hypothetical protein